MTEELIKIFLLRQTQWGSSTYKTYSENDAGRWKNIQSVDNLKEADYLIIYNTPTILVNFPPERMLFFKGEPDEFHFSKEMHTKVPEGSHVYHRPVNHWHSLITYKKFKNMKFPEKTKDLSWITTAYGDHTTPDNCQILEGQKLRMLFLKRFLEKYPNHMYLYGRDLNHYYPMQDFRFCGGELSDKWDGIRDYRYTFAFESSVQNGHFTGKLLDALLGGCMPIFHGCPDLEKYIPKDSFVRIDLSKNLDEVCDEVIEIVKSDIREQNLDEIEAAKELMLDKWNIWEIFYQEINRVNNFLKSR